MSSTSTSTSTSAPDPDPTSAPTPLRIALLCPPGRTVPPHAYAPIEFVVHGLALGLKELGHDVVLCASEDSTIDVPLQKGIGIANPEEIDSRTGELRYVHDAYELVRNNSEPFDIVHDHTLIGPMYARAFPDLCVVTTNHGPWDRFLTPVFQRMSPRVPVVCISASHQRATPTGVRVAGMAYNSVVMDAARARLDNDDTTTSASTHADSRYFAFLGRIDPVKGVHIAIRIAKQLGVPLRIAGRVSTASEVAYFEDCIRPELTKTIEFVGEIGGEIKLEFLRNATAIINPVQWDEPFGLSVVEAEMLGTPVVALRRGAMDEVIADGVSGYVCDTEDELARACEKVHTLSRTKCHEWAMSAFSPRATALAHTKIYKNILSS